MKNLILAALATLSMAACTDRGPAAKTDSVDNPRSVPTNATGTTGSVSDTSVSGDGQHSNERTASSAADATSAANPETGAPSAAASPLPLKK